MDREACWATVRGVAKSTGPPGKPRSRTRGGSLDVTAFSWRVSKRSGQGGNPDEAQGGIKIAGRNINNLRYADDTTFMAESQEELKSLSMKVKEESEKIDIKLNIQKTKIMTSSPITSPNPSQHQSLFQ